MDDPRAEESVCIPTMCARGTGCEQMAGRTSVQDHQLETVGVSQFLYVAFADWASIHASTIARSDKLWPEFGSSLQQVFHG